MTNDLEIKLSETQPNVTSIGLAQAIAPNLNVVVYSAGIMSAYVKCNSTGDLLHITHNIHLRNTPEQWTFVHYKPYSKAEGCATAALDATPTLFEFLGNQYTVYNEMPGLAVQQAFKFVLQTVKHLEGGR